MTKLGRVTPILRMFDEALTKAFYRDFLEFEIVFEARFAEWAPLYMGVHKDDCYIHLSGHFGDATPGSGIRIQTTGLDAYLERLRQKEYKHARPGNAVEQPWGARDITIADPAGNRLTFWEPISKD